MWSLKGVVSCCSQLRKGHGKGKRKSNEICEFQQYTKSTRKSSVHLNLPTPPQNTTIKHAQSSHERECNPHSKERDNPCRNPPWLSLPGLTEHCVQQLCDGQIKWAGATVVGLLLVWVCCNRRQCCFHCRYPTDRLWAWILEKGVTGTILHEIYENLAFSKWGWGKLAK